MEISPDHSKHVKTTIIMLAYRQERYVREAVAAIKTQVEPSWEVVIVDDFSPDGTAEIISSEMPGEEPAWTFIQKEKNGGAIAATRTGLTYAHGDVIIFMAGDDISGPERTRATANFFRQNPECYGLILGAGVIDASGHVKGYAVNSTTSLPRRVVKANLAGHNFLPGLHACGAASAFRREVFEMFPPLHDRIYADDRVYALRAILLGGLEFRPEIHVRWRDHGANLSFLGGRKRGPHLAAHFEGWIRTFDQHLIDVAHYIGCQARDGEGRLAVFRSALEAERARLVLLEAAHRPGLAIKDFMVAAGNYIARHGLTPSALIQVLKPTLQMLIPYPLQRTLAAMRDRL